MKIQIHMLPAHSISLTPRFNGVAVSRDKNSRFNGFHFPLLALGLLAPILAAHAQQPLDQNASDPSLNSNTRIVAETPYAVATRDGNQKVWSKVTWESNSVTGDLTAKTNSYTELATASAHLVNGIWVDSSDQIVITQAGAHATNSQHQVAFLGNINSPGAVDLTLPEGDKHLVSSIIGLSYTDASGKSVMIGEIQDSIGQLLPSGNQVLYTNAFTDFEAGAVNADVLYVNTISKFEQLIVIRAQLPSPAEWDLDPDTTVLQVITEFLNPPLPQITPRQVGEAVDEHLDFGIMQMPKGVAFALGSEANTVPVTKRWLVLDGRQCLIEQTPFKQLEPLLRDLPAGTGHAGLQASPDGVIHRVASRQLLPKRKLARKETPALRLASVAPATKGVAIDYTTLSTAKTNYTFQCDTTYYISGTVNLSQTAIIEGGTVIKFTNSVASSIASSNLVWRTSSYRPAIFTSKNDNTIGENIGGTTGNPTTNFCAGIALNLSGSSGPVALSNARFSYISNVVAGVNGSSITFSNAQFNQCYTILSPGDRVCYFRNCLFYNIGTLQWANCGGGCSNASVHMENVTMHNCTNFSSPFTSAGGTIWLTNTLLVNVTNFSGPSATIYTNYSYVLYGDAGIFQTVGAAAHYLSNNTYRNVGTTNIDATLLGDLRNKTTYPPILLTTNIPANTVLSPQAQRDTDTPDVGYEYDPLDYVVSGRTASTLSLMNGIALGTYGSGLFITGKLVSQGTPNFLNHIVRYNTVQEQATTNWSGAALASVSTTSASGSANCRFTAWSIPGGNGEHFNTAYDTNWNSFTDCQFSGSVLTLAPALVGLTNCLFERVYVSLRDHGMGSGVQWYLFNNLMVGGTVWWLTVATNLAYDNLFDQTTFTLGGPSPNFAHDYNGYVTNKNRLSPNGAHDKILTNSPIYLTSYLGNYYYPTNDGMLSTLTNAGSRTASSATLYHYTCWTNQQKEASSTVDIGFHHVATDSNGKPLDYDGDNIADYLEDFNGNGTYDSSAGETDWQTSQNGTTGTSGLQVFPPLDPVP